MPNRLEVFPKALKFYLIAPLQPGVITIRNGLDQVIHYVGLDFDQTRFQPGRIIDDVAPRSTARISLQYVGSDEGVNLEDEVTLHLKEGDQDRDFVIPVIYNYSDPVTRWVSSRTRQQLEKTEKGKPEPPQEKPPRFQRE